MLNIVLVSGGVDSACMLGLVKESSKEDDRVVAVHYNYGQPTEERELENARKLCTYFDVPLVEKNLEEIIPKGGLTDKIQDFTIPTKESGISTGYVPFRNTLLILVGAGIGASIEKKDSVCVWLGAQLIDYEAYADCRPEFFNALQRVLNLSEVEQTFYIKAPFVNKSKAEVIKRGCELGVPFNLTISCYKPIGGKMCGSCGACSERLEAFKLAGIEDPIMYENINNKGVKK